MIKEIWKKAELSYNEVNAYSIGLKPLINSLLQGMPGHVSEYYAEGYVKHLHEENDLNKCVSLEEKFNNFCIQENGGRLLYSDIETGKKLYLWEDGIFDLTINNNYVTVQVLSHNEKFVESVRTWLSPQWAPQEKRGQIYAIVRNGSHLALNNIGHAGIPLVDGNYTPKVMADYKYAISDLNSLSPSGRIVIMRGPAGTGKTHLIRAMLLQVKDAMFVLISPDMINNLAGPELLPLLIAYRGASKGPIVLVLEDADRCLVAREGENMSLIQSLLNLGDGILGSLLDIRIVATTNADEFKMDSAIVRPGRLSKMLDVNTLDPLTAQKIYKRLLPSAPLPVEVNGSTNTKAPNLSLAEVYALARKNGWQPEERQLSPDNNEDDDFLMDDE